MIYRLPEYITTNGSGVAILAIMELGDLLKSQRQSKGGEGVAILAIMELGDLRKISMKKFHKGKSRNPRYNGIG